MKLQDFFKPLPKPTTKVSKEVARTLGNLHHVNWKKVDLNELRIGIAVELEHKGTLTKIGVPEDKLMLTSASIALDHLDEDRRYYTHLIEMERMSKKKK